MLVERGLQVMHVEVVGDAYAIASNYLRKTGAITDTIATNDTLLEMIVQLFQRGEFNSLFEAGEKDPHRLTVCGLTYLRELDGSTNPVKAGFTGL